MENTMNDGRPVLTDLKEKLMSEGRGLWIAEEDSSFVVEQVNHQKIQGHIDTSLLSKRFGLNQIASGQLAGDLIEKGLFSMRSRLQQSGLNITSSETSQEGLVSLELESLLNVPFTNVPAEFDLCRFFIDLPILRINGPELIREAQSLFPDGNTHNLSYELTSEKDGIRVKWGSELVRVPQMKELDLSKIINVSSREELHRILQLKTGDIDSIARQGFYLAGSSSNVSIPRDRALRIVTTSSTLGWSQPHLMSPIIDPGFTGQIMFEHMRSGSEEGAGEKKNSVLYYLYEV